MTALTSISCFNFWFSAIASLAVFISSSIFFFLESRDLFAAWLFFLLLSQYLQSFFSSGTGTLYGIMCTVQFPSVAADYSYLSSWSCFFSVFCALAFSVAVLLWYWRGDGKIQMIISIAWASEGVIVFTIVYCKCSINVIALLLTEVFTN